MSELSVALDSNLLLLLIVGTASREFIAKHKRLRAFSAEDFDLLCDQLTAATRVVVTPNTLSETSNLIDHIGEPDRSTIYSTLKRFLSLPETGESYVPSAVAAEKDELPRLGITDCALLEICVSGVPLLTADLHLYLAASSKGARVLNFNHIREAAWNGPAT